MYKVLKQPLLSVEIRVACRCQNVSGAILWLLAYQSQFHLLLCEDTELPKFSVISAKPMPYIGYLAFILKGTRFQYVSNGTLHIWNICHNWAGHIAMAGNREEELAENPEGIDYFCERHVCEGSPIKPSLQTSFDVDAVLSQLISTEVPTYRNGSLHFGSILVLKELGGEEDTFHPQALLALRFY